jgi:hypothetical protein
MKNIYDIFKLPASLLLLLSGTYASQLPYNPTRIFLSPQNDRLAYVLQPSSGSQFSLSSLDLSSRLTSSLPYTNLSSTLPFLDTGTSRPLEAVIDSGGNITIYTGNCALGGQNQIWRLNTQEKETGFESWTQTSLTQAKTSSDDSLTGANYLATGISFSSNVSSSAKDTKLYFFGGMCPTTSAIEDTWISSANYSDMMLAYSPVASGKLISYNEAQVSTRNPPISQAGHTMTALRPTYSNRTDGSQTQQQNFVLLGGHTQSAFINMSQVALYSLPQEAWSYFPVSKSSSDTSTQVQPRSGHTATLSADGTKIVVAGGWVGNVNTPATPQIAVLNIAESYGGSGDWMWSVPPSPSTSGFGSSTNTGIYGHGAIALPGNILLVVGGYTIPAPTTSKWRRATTTAQIANSKAYFYNFTSNAWMTDYTAPVSTAPQGMTSSGPLSQTSQKAGLGVGLGIGAVAVAALLALYFWYARRQKRRREVRDREIKSLSFASYQYGSDEWGIPPAEGRNKETTVPDSRRESIPTVEGRELAHGWRAAGSGEAERTGLLVEIPSPTRGLRRSISGRGPYPYEKRTSRNMEPIAERAALEERPEMQVTHDTDLQIRTSALLGNPPTLDPFTDADPLRSNPVSLENSPVSNRTSQQRDEEVKGWMEEWERAAQALITPGSSQQQKPIPGRQSPSKSERTESTLSEQSMHSTFSYRSGAGGTSGIARSLSVRSAAFLNSFTSSFGTSPAASPNATSPMTEKNDARMSLPSQRRRPVPTQTATRPISVLNPDTFTTAPTTLARLQDEGQSLLPSPSRRPPSLNTKIIKNRYRSTPVSPTRESETEMNTSLNRGRKGTGWVGSVRRVISGAYTGRASSMTTTTTTPMEGSGMMERYRDIPDEWERTISPVPGGEGVKRAVSDAAFWKSKRGQKDWLTGSDEEEDDDPLQPPLDASVTQASAGTKRPRRPRAHSTTTPTSSRPVTGMSSQPTTGKENGQTEGEVDTEEEDWDVERAAENRVVQLMFTVPRQRLRVVNCDIDNQSSISLVPISSQERKGEDGVD